MTSQEFSDWLDTCPTHKWEEVSIDDGYISIFINGKNMTSEEFSAYQRNWMNENTND